MPTVRVTRCLLLAAGLAVTHAQLQADAFDWPQWRGPERTGISAETGLLRQWPADGPKLLWKATDLGLGYSTPAVSNGRVYLMGNRKTPGGPSLGEEFLMALDAKDGKPVWSAKVGPVGQNFVAQYPGTRATPSVDGDLIFTLGSDGDLACVEAAGGKLRWQKSLRRDFAGTPGEWAYAESPLVDGDAVICTPGGTEATLVALNQKTGDVIWKAAIPASSDTRNGKPAGYSSVVVAEIAGIRQYVQYLARGLVGLDPKTGQVLWRFDWPGQMNIVTPVVHDNGVFVAHGGNGPKECILVQLAADGSRLTPTVAYRNTRDLNHHHGGLVRIGDYLYGTNDTQLVCMEFKTGKVMWKNDSVGKGSISAADGHLYIRNERGSRSLGALALVEATPEGYREKGKFIPPGRQEGGVPNAWPHPVIANGRLYLRDGNILLCYDVKSQ
jgi:outer membrane protein assembly factor BamB